MDFILYDSKFLITENKPENDRNEFVIELFSKYFGIDINNDDVFHRIHKYLLSLSNSRTDFSDEIEFPISDDECSFNHSEAPIAIALTEKNNIVTKKCFKEKMCDVILSPLSKPEKVYEEDGVEHFRLNDGVLTMIIMVKFSFDIYIYIPEDQKEKYINDWRKIFKV